MKSKTLIFILFSVFLTCQYISELKHKDDIISEAYVNNPNGLALYKTKGDLNSKEVVLNPEEKFYFLEKSNDDVRESWRKVLYGGKELFAYGANYSGADFLEYRKLEARDSRFGVIEKEIVLKELPFQNAKDLEKIASFSVVEILAIEKRYRNIYTIKVKIQNDKIGFIEEELNEYTTLDVATQNASAELESISGFFLITSKEPVFLDVKTMLPVNSEKYKEIVTDKIFHRVNLSRKLNGIRYYTFKSFSILSGPSSNFLIPESNGKFLNEKDYTDYTIEHSRYQGNPVFIRIVRELLEGDAINFLDFKVTKLSVSSKQEYFLATVDQVSFLILKKNGKYIDQTYEESYGIKEVKTFDLDKDGALEILSRSEERGSAYYELIGMKNGKYQVIAYFSTDTKFIRDVIYVKEDFNENLSNNYKYASHFKSHPKGTKLKYKKGKLIKIK